MTLCAHESVTAMNDFSIESVNMTPYPWSRKLILWWYFHLWCMNTFHETSKICQTWSLLIWSAHAIWLDTLQIEEEAAMYHSMFGPTNLTYYKYFVKEHYRLKLNVQVYCPEDWNETDKSHHFPGTKWMLVVRKNCCYQQANDKTLMSFGSGRRTNAFV